MPKRVLDVGNCPPDHAAIRSLIQQHYAADVVQAHLLDDTLAVLRKEPFDLVLVNRKLDRDYSDGLKIIHAIKSDPDLRAVPVMLVTNDEDQQRKAADAGAAWGFGKAQLGAPGTAERLQPFLV